MTTLTSRTGSLQIGAGLPTVLINDQLRILDQSPEVLAELRCGRLDRLLALARIGQDVGIDMCDILIMHHDLDERALLPSVAVAVHEAVGCPISLDTRDPLALEAALAALRPYKALVNSVSAEPEVLDALLPVAAKYGAAVVGMPLGSSSRLPMSVAGRVAEGRAIIEAAERVGIARDDIILDAICLSTSAEPGSMAVTLETLTAFHEELEVATILGIGNAGHGMPDQTRIDLAYLIAAIPWGLDAALVDPATAGLVQTVRAADFLTGRDPVGRRYIKHWRATNRR